MWAGAAIRHKTYVTGVCVWLMCRLLRLGYLSLVMSGERQYDNIPAGVDQSPPLFRTAGRALSFAIHLGDDNRALR